jgi:hypothetical protein
MGMRNPQIYSWMPVGLSDNREATSSKAGDCRVLQNLIHDPTSKGVLAPRPGVSSLTAFPGFNTPGVVTGLVSVGSRVYGMIGTARNAGKDEPFCYDTAAGAFVAISNVTAANTPTTPNTAGPWVPPTLQLVGTKMIVTHPGFPGSGGLYFGWIDLTNPAVPVWNAGNTTGAVPLPSVPNAVALFYNRAYYACGNALIMSDSLNATVVTNAGQILTLGDSGAITAVTPQPMTTGIQGILGALLAFKNDSIWQVTGDYSSTTNALALNEVSGSVGCSAALTVQNTPMGTMFMSNDGVRTVSNTGQVSEPQPDVVFPFYNSSAPSRACATYAADVYRISLDSQTNTGSLGRFDYWFALKYQKWTGPHTFPYHNSAAQGKTFVLVSNTFPGNLWLSNSYPGNSDRYIENGIAMTINMTTSPISPDPRMAEKASVEMAFSFVPSPATYNVQILGASGNSISSATLQSGSAPASWGSGTWGLGSWAAAPYNVSTSPLNFPIPLVFKQVVIVLTGASALYLRLGHFSFRYEGLGYSGKD